MGLFVAEGGCVELVETGRVGMAAENEPVRVAGGWRVWPLLLAFWGGLEVLALLTLLLLLLMVSSGLMTGWFACAAVPYGSAPAMGGASCWSRNARLGSSFGRAALPEASKLGETTPFAFLQVAPVGMRRSCEEWEGRRWLKV